MTYVPDYSSDCMHVILHTGQAVADGTIFIQALGLMIIIIYTRWHVRVGK